MSRPDLRTVPVDPFPEMTAGLRIAALRAEARALANQELAAFCDQIQELAVAAEMIEAGGEAYLPGAREVARQVALWLPDKLVTLQAIIGRRP